MPSIAPDKAKVKVDNKKATIANDGLVSDSSGGKQLYDSGLLYDSGIWYDKWGDSPKDGAPAMAIKGTTLKSKASLLVEKPTIRRG